MRNVLATGLLLAGCIHVPEPTAELRQLSEAPQTMRIVVFPPKCQQDDGACELVDLSGLQASLRSELEFDGHTLIDGVSLVAEARSREEASSELRLFGERIAETESLGQKGALFDDLPPAARRALLTEARADGVLRTSVILSPPDPQSGVSKYRLITAQARLGLGEDEAPAWTVRCTRTGARVPQMGRYAAVQDYQTSMATLGKCLIDEVRSGG